MLHLYDMPARVNWKLLGKTGCSSQAQAGTKPERSGSIDSIWH